MAKFDPCDALPTPSTTQNVVKSTNRFGCYYRQKNPWRFKHPGNRLYVKQFGPVNWLGPQNWRWHRQLSYAWSNTLSSSQRLAWDVLAGLVPYRDYQGNTGYANGWGIFYKLNRFALWQAGGIIQNPPGAFDALAVPGITSWARFDGDIILTYPADFNPPPSLSGGVVVSPDPLPSSGLYPVHYWTTNRLTWGFNGSNWISDAYIDWPFDAPLAKLPGSVGIFTDFYWISPP
jgi:hypothetical protein